MKALDIALVGPGRLGSALLRHLAVSGHRVRAVRSRRPHEGPEENMGPRGPIRDTWDAPEPWPPVDLVFVTVPDRGIGEVGRRLAAAGILREGTVVLHTSGLLTAEVLDPCAEAGAAVGSWHPLQSFPATAEHVELRGVYCAVEGDREAVAAGKQLARNLGMVPWEIEPGAKVLYHAAAALAANAGHLLVAEARRLLETTGLGPGRAGTALAPLLRTSIEEALRAPALQGLTGPMARGDADVIRRHLEALPPHLAAAYEALWRHLEASPLTPPGESD